MRAIFTEKSLFNTVVYGSNETHIGLIMHKFENVKFESTEILEINFFVCIFWFMPLKDVVRITDYSFKFLESQIYL